MDIMKLTTKDLSLLNKSFVYIAAFLLTVIMLETPAVRLKNYFFPPLPVDDQIDYPSSREGASKGTATIISMTCNGKKSVVTYNCAVTRLVIGVEDPEESYE
jgi:hypothetical protein